MHKDIKEKEMTSTQRYLLAYQTCQGWNAAFVQAKRFFDVLDENHGGTPWDQGDANSMFVAERMFLIMAIYHFIVSAGLAENRNGCISERHQKLT